MKEIILELISEPLPRLVDSLAWPISTLLIFRLFKEDLTALCGRLMKAQISGNIFEFGSLSVDSDDSAADDSAAIEVDKGTNNTTAGIDQPNTSKVGSIYWLGNDLMWTVSVILRNAPVATVRHGLLQTSNHLKEVGLERSAPGNKLSEICREINEKSTLSALERKDIAERLTIAGYNLGDLIAYEQEGFQSKRKEFHELKRLREANKKP